MHYCSLLKGDLADVYGTAYGINRDSALNSLTYAHVCDEILPPDIMHDVLEGYLPYVFKLLIHSCKDLGIDTTMLNKIIENFDFGPDCRPSPIPVKAIKSQEGTHLGQSGN